VPTFVGYTISLFYSKHELNDFPSTPIPEEKRWKPPIEHSKTRANHYFLPYDTEVESLIITNNNTTTQ